MSTDNDRKIIAPTSEANAGAPALSLAEKMRVRNCFGTKTAMTSRTAAGTARKMRVTPSWRTAWPPSFHRMVASGSR